MRDELKDRAIALLKDTWAQGYEAGVKATNVDCGVVWEERIDAIREEISDYEEEVFHRPNTDYEAYAAVRYCLDIIDKHCGGDADA